MLFSGVLLFPWCWWGGLWTAAAALTGELSGELVAVPKRELKVVFVGFYTGDVARVLTGIQRTVCTRVRLQENSQ